MKNPDNGNTGTPLDPAADLQPESRFRRLLVPVLLFMLGDVFLLGAVAWWLNPNALLKSISLPPSLDPAEARLMALNLSGDYATGDQSGDRTITISEDGSISLGILGSHDTVFSSSKQHYDAIRQASGPTLRLGNRSLLDVHNRETLLYSGDTYLRSR